MSAKYRKKQQHVEQQSLEQEVERILAWTASSSRHTEIARPSLVEEKGVLALQFGDDSVQSEMYLDRPDDLVIPYTRSMMSFLLLQTAPKHIAMIGLGGGSLAKYCYRYLPKTQMTVVEINPEVIALRNEFAIPADDERFRIVLGDGARFVVEHDQPFDVLLVDGFDKTGLPEPLSTQQFYDDCFLALPERGTMVVNLWAKSPQYQSCLTRIQNSFTDCVLVVDSEDGLNKIVLAVKYGVFPPSSTAIRHQAKLLGQSHSVNFQNKANRLIKNSKGSGQ